jgi:CRP/FNR family transcriptional activator FtrB
MKEADQEALRGLPLFSDLAEDELQPLLAAAAVERCPAGTLIFREGGRARHVHVLLSGIVDLSKVEGRREYGVLMLFAGDVVMPAAGLFDEPYLTSARALTAARLLLLEVDAVRAATARSALLAMRLARVMGGQWRMAVRHILDLKCRSAPERLAAFLLRVFDESRLKASAELPISKRHLASRLGMTAETLSRALQILADNGLFVRGNRIIVRDRRAIDAFCGPDLYPKAVGGSLDVHAF